MTARSYVDLVGFELDEIRQRTTQKDAIVYALSVGLGHDAMDSAQLGFVDHLRSMRVLPSMGFILGHPGVWVADPRLGFDLENVLNAEQFLTLHRPLQPAEEIRSQMRIVGVEDKGANNNVMIHSERVVSDEASGAPIVIVTSVLCLRGAGTSRASAGKLIKSTSVPTREPDWVEELQTRPEQALLYRLNGDDNPMHSDPALAARAGFARPILHGLCTLGFACHALVKTLCDYDVSRVRSLGGRFTSPVYPGETLRVDVWKEGAFRVWSVDRSVLAIDRGQVGISQLAAAHAG